jgi:glycerophosphoryl diester phosphodiesterase
MTRPTTARDRERPPEGRIADPVQLVGHAGLAIRRDGGSPTRSTLDDALTAGIDRLELDVCHAADGCLVLRHDAALPDGRLVGDLDESSLRRADPDLLTLDDAVEHLDGRVPMLLDLKTARGAELLGIWFRRRLDLDDFALCTENLSWLLHLRFAAPRVARWPSFPDIGDRRTHHVQRVVVGLWRSHASLSGLRRGALDVHRAAMQLRHAPRESLGRLGGLPWRERLPYDIRRARDDIAAEGICVHHWVVSEQLVQEAHDLDLHVNTWTVNNPFAARVMADAGVDSVTTDRVDLVRLALQARSQPGRHAPTRPRITEAVRTVPR